MYYYFSWDVGNAHFVIFSTEVYFYTEYGVELIGEQYNWLEQDLKVYILILWVDLQKGVFHKHPI